MTTQPRARKNDPQTSHDAADQVQNISRVQTVILLILWAQGPLTDLQIADHYYNRVADGSAPDHSRSGLRTRRKELVDSGHVTTGEKKVLLDSGRMAQTWKWGVEK